ncbi:MAG TPA: zf-HC2 domain-containing protein [Clostridiales bacterium]|nr:zf-HC2 domain-containing protein [Clostridiales bacterium]
MHCEHVKNWADEYLRGTLPDELEMELKDHLVDCPSCTRYITELEPLLRLMAGLEEEPLPEGFEDRLHKRLMAADRKKPAAAYKNKWIRWSAGLAAAFALAFSIYIVQPWTGFGSRNESSMPEAGDLARDSREYSISSMEPEGSQRNNTAAEEEPELKMSENSTDALDEYDALHKEFLEAKLPSAIYLYVPGNGRTGDMIIEIAEEYDMKVLNRDKNEIALQITDPDQIDNLLEKLAELGRVKTDDNASQDNTITIHVMEE